MRKYLHKLVDIMDVNNIDTSDEMRQWYCNLIYLEGRKCLLFTHAKTLFSFLVPRVRKSDLKDFSTLFRLHAFSNMAAEGLSEKEILYLINDGPDYYAKADNRSILGSMNDYIRTCKFYLKYIGGFERLDFAALNRELNEAPMGYIGMENAGDHLKKLLSVEVKEKAN